MIYKEYALSLVHRVVPKGGRFFMKRGPKIIYLRRKVIAAVGCVAAAVLMCWVSVSPRVVGAAFTERQLPIYCVQKDYKVLSISFDAAWGDGRVRQFSTEIV